ncbi:hypothetical protein [Okeania sp. SIO1I7]|nr:hypothetical protein [Okeania sp. SIO1I7]NET29892.1 hypothetical protein [Okeania sp. SIO1I7]
MLSEGINNINHKWYSFNRNLLAEPKATPSDVLLEEIASNKLRRLP